MTAKATRRVLKVLVLEDHPIAAQGIESAIRPIEEFEIIAVVGSEAEAVRIAGEEQPDLAIVDMTLDKGTGLGAIKTLAAEHPRTRVLVFTMHDERLYAERCMRAGAHGYLTKTASADELVAALRRVAAGKLVLSPDMNERLVNRALGNGNEQDGVDALSDRELEVFELIGRGTPVKGVAEALGISVKTVETHRENIKKKLGVDSAAELARFAVAWMENPG